MPDAFNKTDVCNYLEAEIRLFNSARSEQLQFAHSEERQNVPRADKNRNPRYFIW